MDSFGDCIGLRSPSYNFFTFEYIVVLTHLGKFDHKFGTTVKHNLLWKWVTSKPSLSTTSAISAAVLLGICAISNQLVAVLIIVRHRNFNGFSPFHGIIYGPMRYTHSVSQGLNSACLGGSLPYF